VSAENFSDSELAALRLGALGWRMTRDVVPWSSMPVPILDAVPRRTQLAAAAYLARAEGRTALDHPPPPYELIQGSETSGR
jgi:hypothetical protein